VRKLLFGFVCLIAVSASATTVRLVSPANGEALRGGSLARLDWRGVALPHEAEEWEAFLSVNGGAYYAFRITPHLDLDRRQVTWVVPNVDTKDARILIRVGDERDETGIELPVSFAIKRDASAGLPRPEIAPEGKSEAARDGDDDVIGWANGDRNGERVTQEFGHAANPCALTPVASAVAFRFVAVAPVPHQQLLFISSEPSLEKPRAAQRHRPIDRSPHPSDVLLTSSRLNI
jgi:hypothetical protein